MPQKGDFVKIAIVGTGYVGLVTGVCLSDVGHTVVCVDNDATKVTKLRSGQIPIFEPGLESLVRRNVEHERLSFTTDLGTALVDAACVFIAVGTPQGEDGSADLKYVEAVAREVGRKADHDMLVIVKSTVPVGTCDRVQTVIETELKARRSQLKLPVASNPEFLKEGTAIDDFMKPDRIIVGIEGDGEEELIRELYRPFVVDDPGKLFIMDRRSSELSKYGANAMLATRISFMNEMARLCEQVGANIDNVRRGIGADPRIGRKFLYAGPGYGGSCFPKDVMALLRTGSEYGVDLEVLQAVTRANLAQKRYVAEKVVQHFGDIKGRRVAVWGLSFKPGTDDVRETPSKTIIEHLVSKGATVVGHDPEGMENFKQELGDHPAVTYVKSAYAALEGADALILVTEWSEYKRPNWEKVASMMRSRVVFDFRNQYSADSLREAGFHYYCVGRPESKSR